ncbi:histone deacetylase hos3 [Verticillium dahliae]
MSFSSERRASSSRRQSSTNLSPRDHDVELSQSLNKLSLSASPAVSRAPRSPSALSPYRSSANRSSTSPAPGSTSGRSPSLSRASPSRSSTPTLLRKASTSSLRSANGRTPSQPPSRRSSLAHVSSPSQTSAVTEEPPKTPMTASSVASEYFQNELNLCHALSTTQQTHAAVILSDACYGHRYSRPKTSRAALSTIVERPERIKAGALGVAMAYVRLGGRHCDGDYPAHPKLDPTSIPTVPFKIHKTTRKLPLLSPAVTNVHGSKWMEELRTMCRLAESKLAMGGKELARPESGRTGDTGAAAKLHEGDLYLCADSLDALEGALGAVCEAVDLVFSDGPRRAFVAVRPPGHHCSASYPSGFCWVNNVHVGVMHAALTHGLTHAAIIDFDLHHGDGSQSIAWQHNTRGVSAAKNAQAWKKTSIGYFSLHDINSYPCEMGDEEKVKNASLCIENAHGQNMWNVHLHSWGSEAEFWKLYETKYTVILEKTRSYLQQQAARLRANGQTPKAAIFFSAGFDASEWETKGMQRHNVNVPTEFYARITQDVIRIAAEEGLGVDGRVVSVLEGGYSDRALFSGIFSHVCGLAGDQSNPGPPRGRGGLAYEISHRIGIIEEGEPAVQSPEPAGPYEPLPESQNLSSLHAYDPSWWSSAELDNLEVAMGAPPLEPKMPRYATPPTYSSPTQASTARVVNPAKMRRSLSGLSATNGPISRPPTPPAPEVPWTVAAHELSKLLIPSDRQTDSCTAEDLNAEATRARRDRQSLLQPTVPAPATTANASSRPSSRMSLRERKPAKAPAYTESGNGANDDKHSKSRRKTVAGAAVLATDKPSSGVSPIPAATPDSQRTGRRVSAASTMTTIPPAPEPRTQSSTGGSQGESSSTRPDMLKGARAPGDNTSLAVKKTRTPIATRGGPSRGPRGGKKTTNPKTEPNAELVGPVGSTQVSLPNHGRQVSAHPPSDDLDKITTGMKKIKINLITKSQKEERARSSQAATAAAPVTRTEPGPAGNQSAPRSASEFLPQPDVAQPPVVDETTSALAVEESAETQPALTVKPEIGAHEGPVSAQLPLSSDVPEHKVLPTHSFARPASSQKAQQDGADQSPALELTSNTSPEMFVAYQAEGPAPMSVPQQGSLRWLPPNTSTPATARRTDLPVFTSTSAIPFAVAQKPSQSTAHEEDLKETGAKREHPREG